MRRIVVAIALVLGMFIPNNIATAATKTVPLTMSNSACKDILAVGVAGSGQNSRTMGPEVQDTFTAFQQGMESKGYTINPQPLIYDAVEANAETFFSGKYDKSANGGAIKFEGLLLAAVKACPNQKLVAAGYSQGSDVITRAFKSINKKARGIGFTKSPQADAQKVLNNVVGVVRLAPPKLILGGAQNAAVAGLSIEKRISACIVKDPICRWNKPNIKKCMANHAKCPHFWYNNEKAYANGANTFTGLSAAEYAGAWLASRFKKKQSTPKDVTIKQVWTTDGADKSKSSFCPGSEIRYYVALDNYTGTAQKVKVTFSVGREGAPILKETWDREVPQSGDAFYLPRKVPSGASGKYAYVLALNDNFNAETKAVEFTVAC